MADDFEYDGFISYSHAADGRLAPALQLALEKIARPWYRLRAMRVFRDKTNLSLRPDLWDSIVEHLSKARWFVLLASPEAAASKWVRQEVEWWLSNRSPDRLLIVVTDGELEWGDAAQDFDWPRTTAVPKVLSHVFTQVPFYGDLRWARTLDALTLDSSRFRDAALDIAATLRGVPKDQLDSEAVRTLQRNRLWAAGAVSAVLIFLIGALYYLGRSRQEQWNAEHSLAESQRTLANALASTAATARGKGDLLGAVRLLSEARSIALTPLVEANILATRRPDAILDRALPASLASRVIAFAPGAPILALGLFDGTVVMYHAGEGREIGRFRGQQIPVVDFAFSARGDRLYVIQRSPADAAWNLFSDDKSQSRVVEIDVANPASPALVREIDPMPEWGDFLSIALDPESGRIVVGADRAILMTNSLDAGLQPVSLRSLASRPRIPEGASVSLSRGARYLATATISGRLRVVDLDSGKEWPFLVASPTIAAPYTTFRMVFDDKASRVFFGSHDGSTYSWPFAMDQAPQPLPLGHGSGVSSAALSPDGAWIATGGWDGLARVAPMRANTFGTQLPANRAEAVAGVFKVAFSSDAQYLATTSVVPRGRRDVNPGMWTFGRVHLWRLPGLNEQRVGEGSPPAQVRALGFDRQGRDSAFTGDLPGAPSLVQCSMAPSDSSVACVTPTNEPALLIRPEAGGAPARFALPVKAFSQVLALTWSSDSTRIAVSIRGATSDSSSDRRTRVFVASVPDSQVTEIRAPEAENAITLAWQPGTRSLAIGDNTGAAALLDPATGATTPFKPLLFVDRTLLAWSPDGKQLVAASDSQLRSWKAVKGGWMELSRPIGLDFRPTALATTPGGRLLAIGDAQGRLAFYDLATLDFIASEKLDDAPIVDLRIAADGARLVVQTRNGIIQCGDYIPQHASAAERITHWQLTRGNLVPIDDDQPTIASATGVPKPPDEAAAQFWALVASAPVFEARIPTRFDPILGRRPVVPTANLQQWLDAHPDHPLARTIATFSP